jgi:hypothetical protein
MGKFSTVDEYIAAQEPWNAEKLSTLQKIVKKHAPTAKENIKWAQPVYKDDNAPFCFMRAHKDHVNIGF